MPLDPCVRRNSHTAMDGVVIRNLQRVAFVRRQVEAFEVSNRYQLELLGVLVTMLDYMEGLPCCVGQEREFERWWGHLNVYGRMLWSQEMAGKRARKVLKKLLD